MMTSKYWSHEKCMRKCDNCKRCPKMCQKRCNNKCQCNADPGADYCMDWPKWSVTKPSKKAGKGCAWVAKNPKKRCANWVLGQTGKKKTVRAKIACKKACGLCDKSMGRLV